MDDRKRVRVMMIGPYPRTASRIDGGVAAAITCLSQALIANGGIDLVGVRIAWDDGAGTQEEFDWPIVDLPLGRLSLSTLYVRQRKALSTLIQKHRPQIIHAQGADLAGLLATRSGLPSVVTVHGLLGECAKYQTNPAAKARALLSAFLTERSTVRRASHLIAISPYVTQYYRKEITGRVYEIPNTISSSFFHIRRSPERGRLLFAGRIANGKGLVELLQAVAINRNAVTKVVLAGATPDPAYEHTLRKKVDSLGLGEHVQFAGLLDELALIDQFARAEALVLPSHQETAPMVIQQAMAAGIAVIATNVGGIPFQVQHEVTGLLFQAGDVSALAGAVRRLSDDPTLASRLGDAAKSSAHARYLGSAIAQATLAVYQAALSSSHRPVLMEEA